MTPARIRRASRAAPREGERDLVAGGLPRSSTARPDPPTSSRGKRDAGHVSCRVTTFATRGAAVVLLLATLAFPIPALSATNATVRVETEKLSYAPTDAVVVRVTITNPNDHPIGILRWFTPHDGVDRSLFAVHRDGVAVAYLGRMVKRAAPTDADYLVLRAGESSTTDVALSALYDLAPPGRYEVAYDVASPELHGRDASEAAAGVLRSEPLRFDVESPSSHTDMPPSPR